MNEGQILFNRGCSVVRIQPVNLVQLVRPIVACIVECPATHMSEALSFTKIKPGLLQSLLCTFALSDVLRRTEHLVGSSRRVFPQIAQAVYDAQFPVGTNDPVFTVGALARTNGLFRGPKYILSIFRVDYFAHYRQVNGALLWRQPQD